MHAAGNLITYGHKNTYSICIYYIVESEILKNITLSEIFSISSLVKISIT
jgi:hypothetical protein